MSRWHPCVNGSLISEIREINPAVAVLTLLTLGNAQTRLALLSLTRKVRVQRKREAPFRMSLDVDCDVCRLRLQPPARVLTATALLVAAVVVASVTTLCGFVVVGDGCVGCYHLNLLCLLAQCKLLAEGLARRPEPTPNRVQ